MHILSLPTDSDLALGNVAKTSQKESSAATAELSSAIFHLRVFQSAPSLIPDLPWSCVPPDPVAQYLCYSNSRETGNLQALHHSVFFRGGFQPASLWDVTPWLQAVLCPVPTAPFGVMPPLSTISLACWSWPLPPHLLVVLPCSQSCVCACEQIDGWCSCFALNAAMQALCMHLCQCISLLTCHVCPRHLLA